MFRLIPDSASPALLRRQCGVFLWQTDAGGQLFKVRAMAGKPERLPLGLVAAAEGLKDLEYLNLLELLVKRVKRNVTEAHLIRRILNVEEKLTSIKTGLSPDPEHEVWASFGSEQLREFLVTSCLSLELGVDF